MAKNGGGNGASSIDGTTATIRTAYGNRGYNGGVSFTAQESKLSVSGNLMGAYQNIPNIENNTERKVFTDHSILSQYLKTTQRMHFLMGNINMSYNIDSLNTISSSFGVTGYRLKNRYNPLLEFSGNSFIPSYQYSYDGTMKMSNTSYDFSADWQHFLNTEKNKYFIISYMLSQSPQENEMTQRFDTSAMLDDVYDKNRPKSMEQTIQIDYTMPVGNGQTVNVGSKYVNRRNISLSEYYNIEGDVKTLIDENTSDYRHTSNIGAAYAEYDASMGVFSAKTGLRYEHTWQNVEL